MDQADCLLLNGNGKPVSLFPLSIISWKTAVKLFLTREVFLIKEHKDKVVRSPSFEMKLPTSVRSRSQLQQRNLVRVLRNVCSRTPLTFSASRQAKCHPDGFMAPSSHHPVNRLTHTHSNFSSMEFFMPLAKGLHKF